MKRCVLLVLVLLVASPAANAARLPTPPEKRRIATTAGYPARCLMIRVSTVETQYPWAVAKLRWCNRGNGVGVYENKRGRWVQRYNGPDDKNAPCRFFKAAPAAVAKDLRLCR